MILGEDVNVLNVNMVDPGPDRLLQMAGGLALTRLPPLRMAVSLVPWCHGVWCPGAMVQWYHGAKVLS